MSSPFLIGNTFPFSLIRRHVDITPQSIDELISDLQSHNWDSFWGHSNTLEAAKNILHHDLTPQSERPALTLSSDNLPTLHGNTYSECRVLSPIYEEGFRPTLHSEVPTHQILNWHVLKMTWL